MHAEVLAHVLGPQAFFARHQGLVELLAVARSDDLYTRVTKETLHCLCEVANGRGRGLLDEEVARVGVLEGEGDQVHGLVQVHEEARHVGVRDRDRPPRAYLVDEEGNHAAARAHHIAVAGAADGGAAGA